MVPVAEGSRTADPRASPRGDSAGPGRSDVGARVERAREPPGPLHGRRAGLLSNGARADVPDRGEGPSQGHEEGPIQDKEAAPAGGLGASVSGTTGDLAFLRVIEKKQYQASSQVLRFFRPVDPSLLRACKIDSRGPS